VAAAFDRVIPVRPQVTAIHAIAGRRLLTVEHGPPASKLAAEIWELDGTRVGAVKRLGLVPSRAHVEGDRVLLLGGGTAAMIDVAAQRIERWSQPPALILTSGLCGRVLSLVEFRGPEDRFAAVVWDDFSERPTRRLARLGTTPTDGWRRPPYLVHPVDECRWWLFSEHRFALVALDGGMAQVERTVDLECIACQVLPAPGGAFALAVRGGYRQWRDGKLQWASSFVHGGTPPDPAEPTDAQLFHVDLETGRCAVVGPVHAGYLCSDDEQGVAILHRDGVERFDHEGRAIESIPLPAPDPGMQWLTVSVGDLNWAASIASANFAPGEMLLAAIGKPGAGDKYEAPLHHLAWGPAVERARARYAPKA
jgi:hypothetical protein